ncbi:hypothetical protein DIPPA_32522 [Diplonema papillatum]|nr:hypothetical protein DIPPA_32522 [Diplonema papillatum]
MEAVQSPFTLRLPFRVMCLELLCTIQAVCCLAGLKWLAEARGTQFALREEDFAQPQSARALVLGGLAGLLAAFYPHKMVAAAALSFAAGIVASEAFAGGSGADAVATIPVSALAEVGAAFVALVVSGYLFRLSAFSTLCTLVYAGGVYVYIAFNAMSTPPDFALQHPILFLYSCGEWAVPPNAYAVMLSLLQ